MIFFDIFNNIFILTLFLSILFLWLNRENQFNFTIYRYVIILPDLFILRKWNFNVKNVDLQFCEPSNTSSVVFDLLENFIFILIWNKTCLCMCLCILNNFVFKLIVSVSVYTFQNEIKISIFGFYCKCIAYIFDLSVIKLEDRFI